MTLTFDSIYVPVAVRRCQEGLCGAKLARMNPGPYCFACQQRRDALGEKRGEHYTTYAREAGRR